MLKNIKKNKNIKIAISIIIIIILLFCIKYIAQILFGLFGAFILSSFINMHYVFILGLLFLIILTAISILGVLFLVYLYQN